MIEALLECTGEEGTLMMPTIMEKSGPGNRSALGVAQRMVADDTGKLACL